MSEFLLINIFKPSKRIKVPKAESDKAKKGGLSAKMIRRMKLEAVQCPMTGKTESAVFCYNCSNFVRRVRGQVHCRYNRPEGGEPSSDEDSSPALERRTSTHETQGTRREPAW